MRNQRIPFVFKNFIGDAPARALVLNHYGHNSTYPCSKCRVDGFRYDDRVMVYLGIDHEKRTDSDYLSKIDEDYQKDKTLLAKLSIPPVTRVPFDIMHLVYLGITKKCLETCHTGKYGLQAKLSSHSINELSERYLHLNVICPVEFASRPKMLIRYKFFKATELRHLLDYAGPVILFGIISEQHYFQFLNLHIAMRILTSENHTADRLRIAETALKLFVKYAPDLYSPEFVSYNVHALLHITDDARICGPLEKCSAWTYENNMPLFKKKYPKSP